MKLSIEIDNSSYIKSFLSILTIGILECIENENISIDDSMGLLFSPYVMEVIEKEFPKIEEIIHLGTELDNVKRIIPNSLKSSMGDIKRKCSEQIMLEYDNDRHVKYRIER